ncbi:MAG: hypothetical protein MI922_15555 [Bacteroidales bacterium]|nr:hypothetical protein [Bacteroidales bacterium]
MSKCNCGCGFGNFGDNFEVNHTILEDGVQFKVVPKDKSKTEAFKKFVEACNDFYGKDCC